MKIPLFKPSITQDEIDEVVACLKSTWLGLGPRVAQFEKDFANYTGAKYAIATSSCTVALQITLKALGLHNRQVITTPITFVSTPHIIIQEGKVPVFADVTYDTLNLSPESIKKMLNKRIVAILPVHYGGHPCDIDEINKIADEENIEVFYDCAHALGAEYKGRKIGGAELSCFSFHPLKNITTGDGGMITINNDDLNQKMRKLRWMGISESTFERDQQKYKWDYDVDSFGFKGYMNDYAAALGLIQLRRLDQMNASRRKIVEQYNRAFQDLKTIQIPKEDKNVKSSWLYYVIKTPERERLRIFLEEKGITTGVHFKPSYLHYVYRSSKHDCPIADDVWKKILTLPLYPDMTPEEVEYVIQGILEFK